MKLFSKDASVREAPLLEQEGTLRQRRSWGGRPRMTFCERPPRRFAPPLLCQEGSSALNIFWLICSVLLAAPAYAQTVSYSVAMPQPSSHLFRVEMTIDRP